VLPPVPAVVPQPNPAEPAPAQPNLAAQRGMLWRAACYLAESTRDERIRWYTFISQCVISLMILGFAIAMLSIRCYGPTSIYLTIITGESAW
jgi:hypothetical protein